MTTIKELQEYIGHKFGNDFEDYKNFETKFIDYIHSLCKKNGWEIEKVNEGYYMFSVLIKDFNKAAYISISDLRYSPDGWNDHILVCDFQREGGFAYGHSYTNLEGLEDGIRRSLAF